LEGEYVYKIDGYPYCEECIEDAREEAEFSYEFD